MILTYHNIGQNNNQTWVSLASFQRQMNELKENGYRVVEFEEYDPFDDKQIVLTFDDGRKNILDVVPLLKKNKFPFYVFVVGKFIGYSPEFLAESDFEIIRKGGGKLGWHTQTHQDLTKLSKAKIVKELKNPYGFAY